MQRDNLGVGESLSGEVIRPQQVSLRLVLIPVEALGAANVRPLGDVELLTCELAPARAPEAMERWARAAQDAVRRAMDDERGAE